MSRHLRWQDVPLREIVDEVIAVARTHGEAEVFVHGPVLRIERPGTFSAKDYDDHAGSYAAKLSRTQVTERLLATFVLAVTDR